MYKTTGYPLIKPRGPRQRLAVVGSGISGLAAAWLLLDKYDVSVFEAEPRLGGHTHTVDVTLEGQTFPVDTGFLVFNRRVYHNLCALFDMLGIESVASDMSFSARIESLDLEWAGSNLNTVFGQRRNLLKPEFLGMVRDILRFNRETTALLRDDDLTQESLGDFLSRQNYGSAFRDWYLLPMAAAIWSCPTATMLEYPLSAFVRFCHNHGLLQIVNRPQWLTVKGGGREYVRRLADDLKDVRLSTPVQHIRRGANGVDGADGVDGVDVYTSHGSERFDQVILACHTDTALKILGEAATPAEQSILSAIVYQPNRAVLHTDASHLPQRRQLWSAWNYAAGPATSDASPVAVSYLINMLQPLPAKTPVIVSLNPFREPRPETVIASFDYAHPVFDQAAIEAQRLLPTIQGRQNVWFCGAWAGYGFHEDGLSSALAVVRKLGGTIPWHSNTSEPAVQEVRT